MSNVIAPSPEKIALLREFSVAALDDAMISRGVAAFKEHCIYMGGQNEDDEDLSDEEADFIGRMLVVTILKAALGSH